MICGMIYQFRTRSEGGFQISSGYVLSHDEKRGRIRTPRVWKFQFPATDGYPKKRFGASETYGLLGGVENERRYLYSEACERAIGDIVTAAVCEIIDPAKEQERSTLFIFGPALPKVVGRLASLHLPTNFQVCWVCPKPMPKWITGGDNETTLAPSYGDSFSEEWDDEPLIRSQEILPSNDSSPLLVQQLCTGTKSFTIDLPGYAWAKRKIESALLPRELLVAAEQVDASSITEYRSNDELRRNSAICPEDQYSVASRQRQDYGPAGWDIMWNEPKL
jgi:hypothetical protein